MKPPPPSVASSPSKSSGGNLFSHLKTKASRTKSSPAIPPSTASHSISSESSSSNSRPSPPNTLSANKPPPTDASQSETASSSPAKDPSKLSIAHDCPTMWFGTDDSTIYIYSCFDAVRYVSCFTLDLESWTLTSSSSFTTFTNQNRQE